MTTPKPDWEKARSAMMLDPTVTNLNTGSFGPLPRCVFERVTELRRRLAEAPMSFLIREAGPLLWQARERLAEFLCGDPSRLVFTANVTAAINMVASALHLAAPGEILMSDLEYGTMRWCWEHAAQKHGLTIRTFSLPVLAESETEILDAVCSAFTPRTRLLFFSHVYSATGLVMPASTMCREAKRRGILTVIDGAHAPAMIPLDLAALDCDFYGGNCHKWLLAPTGTGFLYFAPGNEDRLRPLQVSWGWHFDGNGADQRNDFGATHRIYQLEFEGTRDPCPWITAPVAIDFQSALDWEQIRRRNEELVQHARRRMGNEIGLPISTPANPRMHGFLTSFRLPAGIDAQHLREDFWRLRIEAPIVETPLGLLLRVSTHFYNTKEEINKLAEALPNLMRTCTAS